MKSIFLTIAFFFCLSFAAGPVSYYGKLKVREGTPFIDGIKEGRENIKLVQIRGVSFGWSNTGWESERFYNAVAVEHMVKDWKAEVVRAAYGATRLEFADADAAANRSRIEIIVDAAIENDVYVVIDWHSHNAQNEVQNSSDFFEYMAKKYGSYDNVIFELYNEPTNPGGTWANIKDYAETIIPVIRKYSSNLILVGTPNYSQKIEDVVAINDANIGYVVHFYAASHPVASWRDNMNKALNSKIPIFVTEYGTTHADGGNPNAQDGNHYNTHNAARADEWHTYMDSKKISSVAWNINDKYEGSAFFGVVQKGFDQSVPGNWSDTTQMTVSGRYIFKKLNEYYKTAPWNPNAVPIKPPAIANLPQTGDVSVEIFSLQGKKMGNSINNLSSGTYILLLKQGNSQTKSIKFVKK